MACTAASLPASCPAQSWRVPAASSTSSLMTERMALLMILLDVSPTPIGLIPGHLSRAIKRLAVSGASPSGSTYVVHSFLATKAKLLHRSTEAVWNEVQSRLQPVASMPEGPAEPWVCRAAEWMAAPFKQSKITGWVRVGW